MPTMSNVLGLLFANMHDTIISEMTKTRTMGSVLFGGRYRLIDFPLSNMVNSGISEVGVITKSNYQSLLDHLGSGREWDLSRKKGGLYILPPFGNTDTGIYRGRLEALFGAMSFIKNSPAEYVLMSDCDIVANIDYRPILKQHIETNADITVVCSKSIYSMEQTRFSTVVAADKNKRIYDVLLNPEISGACTVSLNMFIVKKDFLIQIVSQAASRSQFSFERDVLQALVRDININAYLYDGYFSRIDSMSSYYKANINLLDSESRKKLFSSDAPIYTKIRDNPPCKYGISASVKNSFVADGCVIEGEIENSIIFRGVKVGKGAKVKNSIIMQDGVIGKESDVNYVITDKNVTIGSNRILTGSQVYPLFAGKGATL
ncbi:MAG: glucose-1-phosphate adenylyltransferase subunit GlgD [Oscillospiraceae bacterium]|jgi:glucose-1-phosphate adenylyltransferase